MDNLQDPNAQEPPAKDIRLEQFSQAGPSAVPTVNETISEEAVRRYLETRPMTTTDLVRKFIFRKTGIQNGQLLQLLASIIRRFNPHRQEVVGGTYLRRRMRVSQPRMARTEMSLCGTSWPRRQGPC